MNLRHLIAVVSATAAVLAVASGPASAGSAQSSVPEKLIYLAGGDELLRLNANGTTDPLFEPRTDACGLTVSPDRSRIAYVVTDGGGAPGDLIVAGLTGDSSRTVARGVACTGGNSPVWMPSSQRLLVRQGNTAPRKLVDVRTGLFSTAALQGVTGYLAFSPNGQYVAYRDGGQIVVALLDGTPQRRFDHHDESPTGGFSVQGVSDDGTRVVVGQQNTDPSFERRGFRLVDAQTGRDIDLPAAVTGPNPRAAHITFLPGTTLLVRAAGHLHLVSRDGAEVLDSRTEPAELSTAQLLTWY